MLFEGKICNFYVNVTSTIFSLIYLCFYGVAGDCGFPAIPDHAQANGSSWNSSGYQTFEEETQVNFTCHVNFSDIQERMRTKTCLNGSWVGKDIQCYEIINRDLYSIVVNDSKLFKAKDPLLWTELYSQEFIGDLGLQLPSISRIAFVRILLNHSEGSLRSMNSSQLPEVRNGKWECSFQNKYLYNSEIYLIHSCSSRVTKSLHITIPYPVKIIDITVFVSPDNKCNGLPEIPLNALAEMIEPATVRYRCRKGFVLQGNETRYCDPKSGLWSPDTPSCEKADEESSSSNLSNIETSTSSPTGIAIGIGIVIVIAIAIATCAIVLIKRTHFGRFKYQKTEICKSPKDLVPM